MGFNTKYDYLKSACKDNNLLGYGTELDRLKGNGTVKLALDGNLSVILIGKDSKKTFLQMGRRDNLKGDALKDYLILKDEDAPKISNNEDLSIKDTKNETSPSARENLGFLSPFNVSKPHRKLKSNSPSPHEQEQDLWKITGPS